MLQHAALQHIMDHVERQSDSPTLKDLRNRAGKTALEVALEVGAKRDRTIYAWERGEQTPTHEKVLALARCLNVSIRQVYASLGFDVSGIPMDVETEDA